jgi:hypothetical protein
MRKKKEAPFKTETELCAAFIAAVPKEWTAYPETWGWDILLVRNADGCQVGVQAKLKLNAKVLIQAAEDRWVTDREGPDYRAALVPEFEAGELAALAPHCSITVVMFRGAAPKYAAWPTFWPPLPNEDRRLFAPGDDWHELVPVRRYNLPDYVPDVRAGASAPAQLTHWKIGALRIAALLHTTGFVTRSDFTRQRVDIRRWIAGGGTGWLRPRAGVFVRGDRWPDFEKKHPVVWEQILADPNTWKRPEPLMQAARPPPALKAPE